MEFEMWLKVQFQVPDNDVAYVEMDWCMPIPRAGDTVVFGDGMFFTVITGSHRFWPEEQLIMIDLELDSCSPIGFSSRPDPENDKMVKECLEKAASILAAKKASSD